ncbi:MAG: LPS assembly lipoprotein LptE [Ignavibacteriaceae bacterium]
MTTKSLKKKQNPGFRILLIPVTALLFSLFLLNFTGCFGCPYSFTGSSVPPHLKTIAIPFSEDRSGSGDPDLRELLTSDLTKKFIDDNSFRITERSYADALLESYISAINDAPAVISSGENIETRRITVGINVTYKDLVQKKVIFEKQFSDFGDYAAGAGIEGRKEAIRTAINKITDSILLDTVSGW